MVAESGGGRGTGPGGLVTHVLLTTNVIRALPTPALAQQAHLLLGQQVPALVRPLAQLGLELGFEDGLGPGSCPGIHNVMPVSVCALGQFFPALDQQDAGVADLPAALLVQLEALLELHLVFGTVREPGAGRLGTTYAAAADATVHLGLMETKHGGSCWPPFSVT